MSSLADLGKLLLCGLALAGAWIPAAMAAAPGRSEPCTPAAVRAQAAAEPAASRSIPGRS